MNKNLRKFMSFFGLVENQDKIDWLEWQNEQKRKLEAGEEIEPPWIVFPNSEPFGWNQGHQEYWRTNVWEPFWDKLSEKERGEYLNNYKPPNENWKNFTKFWDGE
jgi:hypothetical protein